MLFEEVSFKKFSIRPKEVFPTLRQYRSSSWNDAWEVMCLKNATKYSVMEWAAEHATGTVEVAPSAANCEVLIAFSDPTDAVLFKISYTETGVFEL